MYPRSSFSQVRFLAVCLSRAPPAADLRADLGCELLSPGFCGSLPFHSPDVGASLHLWHVRGSHDVPAGRQEHARPVHDATSPPGSGPPAWLSAPPELPCVPALDSAPGDQPALGVRLAGQSRFPLPPRPLAARVPVSEAAAASGVFLVRRRSSLL